MTDDLFDMPPELRPLLNQVDEITSVPTHAQLRRWIREAYDVGHDTGYSDGYGDGDKAGYRDGYLVGSV